MAVIDDRNKLNRMSVTSIAKRRWKLLAKALCNRQQNVNQKSIEANTNDYYLASIRRFTCFNLFQRIPINKTTNDTNQIWMTFRTIVNGMEYSIHLREVKQKLTPEHLIGFNNTGNICLWPSEESLAYFVLNNLQLFNGQRVLELGGGMTCLAGLFVTKYAQPKYVHLTDGNEVSIQNVCEVFRKNFIDPRPDTKCSVLKWENVNNLLDENEQYDCIMSADCLFFDSARSYFVAALWQCLKPTGMALIMAPRRGQTLNQFIVQAQQMGFECNLKIFYNNIVWQKHLSLLATNSYEEDIHYPLLIEVRKSKMTN